MNAGADRAQRARYMAVASMSMCRGAVATYLAQAYHRAGARDESSGLERPWVGKVVPRTRPRNVWHRPRAARRGRSGLQGRERSLWERAERGLLSAFWSPQERPDAELMGGNTGSDSFAAAVARRTQAQARRTDDKSARHAELQGKEDARMAAFKASMAGFL